VTVRKIGKYRVVPKGRLWVVELDHQILEAHPSKWDALKAAKKMNWRLRIGRDGTREDIRT
jgi:hypothetical protein